MATRKPTTTETESKAVDIKPIRLSTFEVMILGLTPMIMNQMSEKARQQLLLPSPRKNQSERESTLKHRPLDEFRDSAYRYRVDSEPTRLYTPAPAWKKAIMQAAVDMPGSATKAGVGRKLAVLGESVPIYGIPRLRADMVRQSGMSHTPDVRFRCEVPRWACRLKIRFALLGLNVQSVINLIGGSGLLCGVGDYRQEKGAGDFGQFTVVGPDDRDLLAEWKEIVKTSGREAQDAAMEHPEMSPETEALLAWHDAEIERRGRQAEIDKQAKLAKKARKEQVSGNA